MVLIIAIVLPIILNSVHVVRKSSVRIRVDRGVVPRLLLVYQSLELVNRFFFRFGLKFLDQLLLAFLPEFSPSLSQIFLTLEVFRPKFE